MQGPPRSDIQSESFKTFIGGALGAAISPGILEQLLVEPSLENYFRRAFTHKTAALSRPPPKTPKFDYDVIEKIGDGVLKASFQLWLFEIMGTEVTTPQIYSDMEKRFTGTEHLSDLSDVLGFDKWIQVAEGTIVTINIKEDVFESMVAAIVLAGDHYVMKDIGFALAKRWIFQVFNTTTRDRINPKDPRSYTDFRSQVNDIWQFHGWGTPLYREQANGAAAKSVGAQPELAVSLMGPNKSTFPQALRDGTLGNGTGFDLPKAKEKAAEEALKKLGSNYPELRGFELQLATADPGKFKTIIGTDPVLLANVMQAMGKLQKVYQSIAIRKMKAYGVYGVQLRVLDDGIWRSSIRTKSSNSFDDAIIKAFKAFVQKFNGGGALVGAEDGEIDGTGEVVPVATASQPKPKPASVPSGGRGGGGRGSGKPSTQKSGGRGRGK
jgi:dsRNA-specific ribonuclease